MKKETFFGLTMLTLAGCSTTSQPTAALDAPRLELESLKPEQAPAPRRLVASHNTTHTPHISYSDHISVNR